MTIAIVRPALSRREREVLELVYEGATAREIGRRLYISERTVETHTAHAYAKLGIRSRFEVLRRGAEFGLGQRCDA